MIHLPHRRFLSSVTVKKFTNGRDIVGDDMRGELRITCKKDWPPHISFYAPFGQCHLNAAYAVYVLIYSKYRILQHSFPHQQILTLFVRVLTR